MQKTAALHQDIQRGSSALFFIQIFSTLAYSILYISLVLFSVQGLHLPATEANHIVATFIAFNFALHLIGGFFGGRLLSFRSLFLIGMTLQTIGCLLISKITLHFLFLGMAIFMVGSGMNVPCINCLIAQLFHPTDRRRDYAFLWNYSGMNIGFFIGVSIAGFFQTTQSFHELFLLTSISNVIALLITLFHWKKLSDVDTPLSKNTHSKMMCAIAGMLSILFLIFILNKILMHAIIASQIILALGIAMAIMVVMMIILRKNPHEKKQLIAYSIFAIGALVFYTVYQLIPMGLTLFLEHNVNRQLLGITIPPAWFLNIDTAIIIIGCPLLSIITQKLRKKGYYVNLSLFFSAGLMLIGLAVLVLPVGIYFANTQGFVSIEWPAFTYLLLSLAEIALSPIGYALVAELSPPDLRGILMGVWLMVSGVAAIISNIFSNNALGPTKSLSPLLSNPTYSATFLHLGLAGIAMGLIITACRRFLRPTQKCTTN